MVKNRKYSHWLIKLFKIVSLLTIIVVLVGFILFESGSQKIKNIKTIDDNLFF